VQEELASTIDALQRRRSLMVFTSAASPAHLPSCDPALVSRLHGGLTIEISALSGQSQRAFVTQLLVRLGWRHHQSLIETIVAHTTGEPATLARRVAELNQAFPRGQGATPAAVTQTLNRHVAACAPSLADILRIVSRYYSVPQRQVTSGSRQQQVVQARAMVIALARSLTPLSYEQIGSKLGGRDHTTMMHHHRKIESRLPTDVALRSAMADLKRLLERR
jgi:chromosomal replication initiator protein